MNSSTWTIPLAIIAGGAIVAGAVFFSMREGASVSGSPERVRPVDTTDHIFGNPSAPVVIVEYSDFDCQYCKTFHETLYQVVANEGADGSVAWVFRHFPLSEIHPNALAHARAAECVAANGGEEAFWKFADLLFKNQPSNPSQYGQFAQEAGASAGFASCYANPPTELEAGIAADRQNATLMGTRGTPYSVVLKDGQFFAALNGAYSYDAMKAIVAQALGE